jgi:2-keto-4-pentenoate hydratase/2-oxohepta-3-ene-1,7-dioic acid hydratase in catechol pathway
MKICQYKKSSQAGLIKRLGIIDEDENIIIDPNLCWWADYERDGYFNAQNRAVNKLPPSLFSLLNLHDSPIEALQEANGLYQFLKKVGKLTLNDGTPIAFKYNPNDLAMPLDKIGTYRDFFTHEKHVKTGFAKRNEPIPEAWFEMPVYYKGATAGFIGPNQEILWPHYSKQLDYELELAAVISKDGKNIKARNAKKHILGFTILNDVSARDIQRKEMQVRLGPSKGKDFCSVIGPVIVTYDEFDFKEPNLKMTCKINGKEWSKGQSGDSKYSFAEMLEFASMEEWILPGDLLGSGTVGTGCGLELDKWIKSGDLIEMEIEKIGILKNIVGKPHGKF